MNNSSSLASATTRLEQNDATLTSIDLRGKGRYGPSTSSSDHDRLLECSDHFHSDTRIPRPKIQRFISALKNNPRQRQRCSHHSSPSIPHPLSSSPSSRPYSCSQLNYLALHNHFLDPCELPLLFDALPYLFPSLETLVLFHHDLGDHGVDLLMQALIGSTTKSSSSSSSSDGGGGGSSNNRRILFCDGNVMNDNDTISQNGLVASCETKQNNNSNCGRLKELYISHCNISCKGACAIANALDHSSCSTLPSLIEDDNNNNNNNKLKHLQVLSLGSNQIQEKGTLYLARAFGRYPSLQRMVLHGNNQGIASSSVSSSSLSSHNAKLPLEKEKESKIMSVVCHALNPAGWQRRQEGPTISTTSTPTPTTRAMEIFTPLILPHIRSRWHRDRVLVRPPDLLRRRLREEMHKHHSTFIDTYLEDLPDIFAWMGRIGPCCRQTSLHSSSFGNNLHNQSRGMCCRNSRSGWDEQLSCCGGCAAVSLNDVYELLGRMPHLVYLLRSISVESVKSRNGNGVCEADQGEYL